MTWSGHPTFFPRRAAHLISSVPPVARAIVFRLGPRACRAKAEETSMTIYISQGRYTAAAIKGMSAKPEDRSEAVAELFAAAGARLISWYLTLGPYDWLIIAEAPDEPTMISAVLAAAAGGSLSDITTTVALTASDTAKAFQRAGELTLKFRSAGRADYYGVGIDSGREIGEA